MFKKELKKCFSCNSADNLIIIGIDIDSRQRVYRCTSIAFHEQPQISMNGFEYEGNMKFIQCPICKHSEHINYNGKDGIEFICTNKKLHQEKRNFKFTIMYPTKDMTLKNFIIESDSFELYEKLHKIHMKAKKAEGTTLAVELVNSCLELGLNEEVISRIFSTSQPTLNRFIHREDLPKYRNKYFVKVKIFTSRIFYTTMIIDKRYYS